MTSVAPVAGSPGQSDPAALDKAEEAERLRAAGMVPDDPASATVRRPRWGRWLGTPVFLGAVVVALYFWVDAQDLSDSERRLLTRDFIWNKVTEHLSLTFVSTIFVILIAVPAGVALTRKSMKRLTPAVVGVANIGQAVPSYGVLVLFAMSIGIGFEVAIYALVIYAILPVLRNTMVGIDQVDESFIEAGRGMGLTSSQVLLRVELPLAVPVMLAGIRTALIINVGTATLATFTGAGGLGLLIDAGNKNLQTPVLVVGSVLTAVIALTLDWVASIVEDALRPKGL